MKFRMRLAAAAAMIGMTGAAQAQTAGALGDRCIPGPAAEALILTVAPEALRKVAEICVPQLGSGAALRRVSSGMIARYAAESDTAWPVARGALGNFAGAAQEMLNSELARPLLTTVVTEVLTKEIKPRDCGAIDRILGLIDPLPPRNAAALVVTLMQLAQKPGKPSKLLICQDRPRQ